jgi:hypothetical protein
MIVSSINPCLLNSALAYCAVKAYASWKQVAGYFDGDGNLGISDLSNQPFKLGLSLVFTDQSLEQISMLRAFFLGREIKTSNVLRTSSKTAWIVVVSRYEMVLLVLKKMLPHLFKKSNEAAAAIDYYEGRITGNQFVSVLQEEVLAGRRERRDHRVEINVPFTYFQGEQFMREKRSQRLRDAFGRFRAKVNPSDFWKIREEHFVNNLRIRDLVAKYPQYSRETIRRILGRGRGYVGVKGLGLVTTDTTIREPRRASH